MQGLGCSASWLTTHSTSWNAGQQLGDNVHSLDNHCGTNAYRSPFTAGSDFQRQTSNATWFTGAASAFGASLRARSGFSSYVISHWHFGTAYPRYWLCGSNNDVTSSHRIYAGW
jgi:hypothetical protein